MLLFDCAVLRFDCEVLRFDGAVLRFEISALLVDGAVSLWMQSFAL